MTTAQDERHEAEATAARKAGIRLLVIGGVLMVVGVCLVVVIDRESGGAVSHAKVFRSGYSVPLIAGYPGTLGYVIFVLGLHRLISGRSPDHDSRSIAAVVGSVVGSLVAGAIFCLVTFVIVMKLRG